MNHNWAKPIMVILFMTVTGSRISTYPNSGWEVLRRSLVVFLGKVILHGKEWGDLGRRPFSYSLPLFCHWSYHITILAALSERPRESQKSCPRTGMSFHFQICLSGALTNSQLWHCPTSYLDVSVLSIHCTLIGISIIALNYVLSIYCAVNLDIMLYFDNKNAQDIKDKTTYKQQWI